MNEEQLRKQVTGSQELERQRKSEEESLVAGEGGQEPRGGGQEMGVSGGEVNIDQSKCWILRFDPLSPKHRIRKTCKKCLIVAGFDDAKILEYF